VHGFEMGVNGMPRWKMASWCFTVSTDVPLAARQSLSC